MAKILITGGAGFIGSHTADELLRQGHRVVILDNLSRPVHDGVWPKYVQHKKFTLIRGDVRKKADLMKALEGVSYIYHLAAYQDQRPDFGKFFETNTVSTALIYELIVQSNLPIKKIIIASSQFVYGDGRYQCRHSKKFFYPELRAESQFESKKFDICCEHGDLAKFFPFRETQPLAPTNSYGLSKEALEHLALRLGKTYGIPTTIFRYSIVQGSRQSPRNFYSGALRIFVTQAIAGKPITVFEDGGQIRDFVNVADVVSANLIALRNPKTNFEIFNVGGGKGYKVLDFANLVKRIARSSSPIIVDGFRRTDTRHSISNISKLKQLGWLPKGSPEKSIQDYIVWYKNNFL